MKTLEIPVRKCMCGEEMILEVFRPYDQRIKGEALGLLFYDIIYETGISCRRK